MDNEKKPPGRTGRKTKPGHQKVKQKKVYITDEQEIALLKKHDKPSLTELIKSLL